MKKLLTLLLTFVFAIGALTGCGKQNVVVMTNETVQRQMAQMPSIVPWMRSRKAVPLKSAFSATKILSDT